MSPILWEISAGSHIPSSARAMQAKDVRARIDNRILFIS
jgi:hypothetical protein